MKRDTNQRYGTLSSDLSGSLNFSRQQDSEHANLRGLAYLALSHPMYCDRNVGQL